MMRNVLRKFCEPSRNSGANPLNGAKPYTVKINHISRSDRNFYEVYVVHVMCCPLCAQSKAANNVSSVKLFHPISIVSHKEAITHLFGIVSQYSG